MRLMRHANMSGVDESYARWLASQDELAAVASKAIGDELLTTPTQPPEPESHAEVSRSLHTDTELPALNFLGDQEGR